MQYSLTLQLFNAFRLNKSSLSPLIQKVIRSTVFTISLIVAASLAIAEEPLRPDMWAVPVAGNIVKNFYQMDEKVYRSAQPDDEDMEKLEAFGIREVLNLRLFHTDIDEAEGTKLKLHHVRMRAGNIEDKDVITALKYIRDSEGPIVIHCWHGSDRTGVISAMYRIIYQGWSKEDATKELIEGGYGHHDVIYGNIPEYIEGVDVAKIRKSLE